MLSVADVEQNHAARDRADAEVGGWLGAPAYATNSRPSPLAAPFDLTPASACGRTPHTRTVWSSEAVANMPRSAHATALIRPGPWPDRTLTSSALSRCQT